MIKRIFLYSVLFHASTMMPNTRPDHEFKKKLIGNDYVIIVYNENDYSFEMKTLKVENKCLFLLLKTTIIFRVEYANMLLKFVHK